MVGYGADLEDVLVLELDGFSFFIFSILIEFLHEDIAVFNIKSQIFAGGVLVAQVDVAEFFPALGEGQGLVVDRLGIGERRIGFMLERDFDVAVLVEVAVPGGGEEIGFGTAGGMDGPPVGIEVFGCLEFFAAGGKQQESSYE